MKRIKIIFTYPYSYITIFILFMSNCVYAQILSIDPSEQNIAVESGQQISTNVTLLNQSSQYSINYKIRLWNSSSLGLIGVNPTLDQNLSLAQNQIKHNTFTFSLNTTTNQTSTYTFRVDWMLQNGLNIEATSYFTINVTYLSDGCSLSPPGVRRSSNILSTSAVINWIDAPNVYGYKVYIRDFLTGIYYYSPLLINNFYELNNLTPNRSYYWAVKAICADGTEGEWSTYGTSVFTTLPSGCSESVSFGLPVSSNKDVRVSGTIYAASTIYQNLDVKFRAEEIVLRPGFSVSGYDTGVFRAYVDPCTASKTKNQQSSELAKQENKILPVLSPNPTSTFLNVENIEDIVEWKLVDINGKTVDSGKANNLVNKITINTGRLNPGIYYFNAVMKNGELFRETVMKK